MNIYKLYDWVGRQFRPARMRRFLETFPATEYQRVLDLGGGGSIWEMLPHAYDVTLLNTDAAIPHEGYRLLVGDGCQVPAPDQSFDCAFSNSTIEHVGDFERQRQFAQEMQRVGRTLYCQTPNKWFPIEPHFLIPFVHWFTRLSSYGAIRWLTPFGWIRKPSRELVENYLGRTRLLTRQELEWLFPGCEIWEEKFLGMTKSFVVVGRETETGSNRKAA